MKAQFFSRKTRFSLLVILTLLGFTTMSYGASGVSLAVVGNTAQTTTDLVAGVTYTLKITNTGTASDTILLQTSAEDPDVDDVFGALSTNSIVLGGGDSADVTLTVTGDSELFFSDYPVTVWATSDTDSNETAQVTTTTTFALGGVSLAVVGDTARTTTNPVAGVTYTLKITNTTDATDTILLQTSAEDPDADDVLGTLSTNSIVIGAGDSADVTVTVTGDSELFPSDYPIIVTATSDADSNESQQVTLTTTIAATTTPPTESTTPTPISAAATAESPPPVSGAATTESPPPVSVGAGVSLAVVGDTALTTTDPVAGVTYTLTVTNTGTASDTILLQTSAEDPDADDVLGTLSTSSIVLGGGDSADVTLTVTADSELFPSDYPVIVTATSDADSNASAQVTLTTTIAATTTPPTESTTPTPISAAATAESPPPVSVSAGVSLDAVGEKTGITTDPVVGVIYTLTVTNTGTASDTISLQTSAEDGPTGSVLGILTEDLMDLEAGASAEVTLTVAGDSSTVPGIYPITVTATSATDSTKTAQVTTTTEIQLLGDINGDGIVNIQDLTLVADQLGASGDDLKADLNGDGTVNILDLVIVAANFTDGSGT